MRQQHGHAAFRFALFAPAHVLDLPGEVLDVEFGVATASCACSRAQASTSSS